MVDDRDLAKFIAEHEYDDLDFDCPDCGIETEAHLLVDRRDVGSGCTWVQCVRCFGPYNSGMWELEDVFDKVRVA